MRAVLLATTPGARAAVDEETVSQRLIRQIGSFKPRDITVITRPEYRAGLPAGVTVMSSEGVREDLRLLSDLAAAGEPLLLACADTVLPDTAVSAVMSDPTSRSGVLVGQSDGARPLDVPVFKDRGLVLSVSTGFHKVARPNAVASGLLKVSQPFMDDLDHGLGQLRDDSVADLAPGADAWTLVLLALVRGGTKMNAYAVPGLPYGRVAGEAGARALLADIKDTDEDAVRLDLCVKKDDDLFATYCISSYSRHVVKLCAKLRLTPVGVTWLSILFALGAAALFFQASRPALIGGAVAMYVSFVLDCVDGQLARYKHRFTNFGGWLDMIADRGKEFILYAGLAAGAASQGLTWAWPLALAAITIQTSRHMVDTWYGVLQDQATLRGAVRELTDPVDGYAAPSAGGGSGGGAGALAAKMGRKLGKLSDQFAAHRRSPSYWFKRTIVFPVGERWLVMGVGAAVFDGRIALAALLTWQLIALTYILAGRGLRGWAAKVAVLDDDTATYRDDGPLRSIPMPLSLPPLPVVLFGLVAVTGGVVWAALDHESGWLASLLAAVGLLLSLTTARHRHDGPFDWLIPGILRAAEFGLIITVGLAAEVPSPLTFGLLAVLALYHYDLAARIDKAASPMLSRAAGLGWDGRSLVVLLALIPGIGTWVFAILLGYIALVFVGGALAGRRGKPKAVAVAA
ncbi:DUF5941 domain-containing protein [Stackebrandtia nassauensis]|uniref:CDP-alcohol phosphatidyltransferase n=1 Tax=Stackebrandtia nassauensis (strain DSM 44728 / CIP 108903 / NRRL B-16338 / NBRC 102104 / LLR-40K-21) TaxID=446470 RepID=D3PXX2_STANL|nr:DUF5941 domain-containing protein [Stackebrandtia nassauensis]ADD45301.1 CDP-alcohol phosphatidyltransferase [Stackebrandtia nassauensis DSM 44728]